MIGHVTGVLPDPSVETPPEVPSLCRKLRTKTSYGVGSEGELWKLGRSTTAVYWCLVTMEPFGPDDSFCHPHHCGKERGCYQPADD